MQQQRVLVNGLWQSWPQVEHQQTVCEMLLSHQPDKFVFVQSPSASNRAAAAARETLSLADLMLKARQLGLPTRFSLRTGDVVVVQSPSNLLLGITSVLACLMEGITVLPISIEVTPRQVFDIINACTRTTAVGNRVVMLATRQQLWDLDYVLAQFGAGTGSLGGEGDFPSWCESDLTCGLDPKLLPPAQIDPPKLDDACMLFYLRAHWCVTGSCGENVRAFCQSVVTPAAPTVFKTRLAHVAGNDSAQPVLLYLPPNHCYSPAKQQLHRLRRPNPIPTAPLETEELSQVVQLLLKLDSRCGARLAGNNCVEVLGPWCFRQTLLAGKKLSNGFVLDQRTMTWWFSAEATGWLVVSEEHRVVSSSPPALPAGKRAIKPVRRVKARL
ncbi:hypothetical protein BASA81_012717 [Batrachochytrium salamandrivorans]|nr:hypothetical protein BASA81_012717 [Batrachochytrium salamandrivorans]